MKYESTILKRLIDTYGVVGNPRYISEIIREFIVRGKERFPELFTYQSDWLAHIDVFGLNPSYMVSYTGQSIYTPNSLERPVKSAILKGSTKYRDIDTGEVLDAFEDGRNLELVSVRMPVLTTTGKNLFDGESRVGYYITDTGIYQPTPTINQCCNTTPIQVSGGTKYSFLLPEGDMKGGRTFLYDSKMNFITSIINEDVRYVITTTQDTKNINFHFDNATPELLSKVQIEEGSTATSYEPYKSNILTVNEDVTLRSNGSVCDELDLLTGKLTQRIDEDGEVLPQEVIKTVDLTILDQNGQNVKQLMSFNGGTHFNTGSLEGSLLPSVSVTVETDLEETLKVCSLEGNTL